MATLIKSGFHQQGRRGSGCCGPWKSSVLFHRTFIVPHPFQMPVEWLFPFLSSEVWARVMCIASRNSFRNQSKIYCIPSSCLETHETKFMGLLSTGSLSDDLTIPCLPPWAGSMREKWTFTVRSHGDLGVICYCSAGQTVQLEGGPVDRSSWKGQPGNTCWEGCTEVPAGKCHLQQLA